jgi:hypothetical protein
VTSPDAISAARPNASKRAYSSALMLSQHLSAGSFLPRHHES